MIGYQINILIQNLFQITIEAWSLWHKYCCSSIIFAWIVMWFRFWTWMSMQ